MPWFLQTLLSGHLGLEWSAWLGALYVGSRAQADKDVVLEAVQQADGPMMSRSKAERKQAV